MHTSQDKIWTHFQNAAVESFDAARPRLEFLVRDVARRVRVPSPAVLNIGIGNGHFERQAHDRGWQVHSLDPDPSAVHKLQGVGVQATVGYIERMPFANGQFDAVVASEVLEHLSDEQRDQGLREIARVLKPKGWFLGTVPYNEDLKAGEVVCPGCGEIFHRWGHHKSFTVESLRGELGAHFAVREARCTAFVSYVGRSLVGKLKSLVRVLLARAGHMVALPNVVWAAQPRE